MTTTQIIIASITAIVLVWLVANTRWKIRRLEISERVRMAELDAADKARREETRRVEAAAEPVLVELVTGPGPALGASLAVHIDDRVVQGTLDDETTDRWIVLTNATLVGGEKTHELGGDRQYLNADRVTQVQEF